MRQFIAILIVLVQVFGGLAGAVTIDTVPVGNTNNTGELSGSGAGGEGPNRICGAVSYEYNIGKYEVTAGQYVEFLNAVAATDTYGLYKTDMDSNSRGCQITRTGSAGSYTYDFSGKPGGTTDAGWASRPVSHVSWGDAARFANWLHNGQPSGVQGDGTTEDGAYYLNGAMTDAELLAISREADWKWAITTEDEWYKAAYYDTVSAYFDYPTSSNTTPGYVNDAGNLSNDTDTAFTDGVTDPGNYATYDGDSAPDGIGPDYYRTLVGEWENSGSPYGTFDQGGNVWEWNEAIIGSFRGWRGGSFSDGPDDYQHASYRYYHYPTFESYRVGFRVASSAAIPEPGSVALLVCGLLGCLVCARRRRR